jgi:lipooligosaccharide transport system permease protein
MFASIAMVFTSFAPAIHSFNYYFTLFITPMFLLSGIFFPLSSFPSIAQTLSWIAPLTPVAYITRALFNGEIQVGLLYPLALIIGIAASFFFASLVTMKRRLIV